MSGNTNNEAVFVGDLPQINTCNTSDLLMIVVYSDPANTATATLKVITVGHLSNVISGLIS